MKRPFQGIFGILNEEEKRLSNEAIKKEYKGDEQLRNKIEKQLMGVNNENKP